MRSKKTWGKVLFLVGFCLLMMLIIKLGASYISSRKISQPDKVQVFVSILPQKYFVERIGGEHVNVAVMVGPGQNPATYEPLPQQMSALTDAQLYLRIGVPFETAWINKLSALNPKLIMVDTREGIPLRTMDKPHFHHEAEVAAGSSGAESDHTGEGLKDPHIWLDPLFVKIQAATISRALSELDPAHKGDYEANLADFQEELDRLHQELTATFKSLKVKKLMVYHPAWGYLTERYGLEQIPLEVEGKEPGPRELAHFIDHAREEGIRVIFIQSQFNTEAAAVVARAINGQVVAIDPLAEDYLINMGKIAEAIKRSHDPNGECY